jgi:hypothetical protein
MAFNLEYEYPRGYAKTSYINQNKHRDGLNLQPALILARTKIRPRIDVLAC